MAIPIPAPARLVLRVLLWLGIVAMGVEALYVIVINVALSTSLFGKIANAKPDVIDIHYRRAWSWLPGRVTAKDLSIRGADSNVQWILRIDDVTFTCSLFQLAKKHFHATHVRGTGVSYRIRENVESPEATATYVKDLPPVDGFGPVGIRPSDPFYPGTWSDKDWHLWTIELEDVVAENVREIWFDAERFQGDARLAGSFYLKPIRDVRVGPVDILVRGGEVRSHDRVILDPVALQAEVTIREFDPRTTLGDDLLHHVNITGDGAAKVPDVGKTPLAPEGKTRLSGPIDVTALAVRIVDGIVRDGTQCEAHATEIHFVDGSQRAEGALGFSARVSDGELRARFDLHRGSIDSEVHVARAFVAVDSRSLDLATPLLDLHGVIAVPEASVDDAKVVSRYFPSPKLAIERGALHAEARAEAWLATRRIEGEVTLRGEGLGVRVGKDEPNATRLDGDVLFHTVARSGAAGKRHVIDLAGTSLALRNVRVRGGLSETGWTGDLSLANASIDPFASKPGFVGDAALEARDATPILAAAFGDSVPLVVREIAPMPHFSARVHVDVSPGRLVVSNLHAVGGNLDLRGIYVARREDAGGALVVAKGPLSMGLGLDEQGSHVHLFGLDSWFDAQTREATARASQ